MTSPASQQQSVESIEELRRQYHALRTSFHAVLITLIVLSGSLTFFLWRQVALLGRQVDATRPVVSQMAGDYDRINGPMIRNFVNQLQIFGRTNPDFLPILTKYVSPSTATGPAPSVPQAPAPSVAQTKPAKK